MKRQQLFSNNINSKCDLWKPLRFFYTGAIFLFFEKKNQNRLCPLPYEEVLEAIFRLFGQYNVGISEIPGEGCT